MQGLSCTLHCCPEHEDDDDCHDDCHDDDDHDDHDDDWGISTNNIAARFMKVFK